MNLIIESGPFYKQLSTKDQTVLLNHLSSFSDFRRNFRPFFDPCEQGFINEVLVNLAVRRFPGRKFKFVHKYGKRVEEMYFIVKGSFALSVSYFAKIDPKLPFPPFCVMRSGTTFGDY